MLVTADPMGMAVGFLLGRGGPYFHDFDVEGQRLAGERMIGIRIHIELADLYDGDLANALIGLHADHHARLRLDFAGARTHQVLDGDALEVAFATGAVRLRW